MQQTTTCIQCGKDYFTKYNSCPECTAGETNMENYTTMKNKKQCDHCNEYYPSETVKESKAEPGRFYCGCCDDYTSEITKETENYKKNPF